MNAIIKQEYKSMSFLAVALAFFGITAHFLLPFDKANWLTQVMHYLDIEILRNDLLNGLFYLHAQPPLMNLLIGLALKIIPLDRINLFFEIVYFFIYVFLVFGVYLILKQLKLSNFFAGLGGVTIIFFPSLVMAERWLWYPLPLALLFVLALFALYNFFLLKRLVYFILLLSALTAIIWLRSFFHLIFWSLPLVFILLFLIKKDKNLKFKKYLLATILFFLIASAPYLKNYFQFGKFSVSTWQGMNLAKTAHFVSDEKIKNLISKGEVSELALIAPFSSAKVYYDYYKQALPDQSVKAIDDLSKTGGAINFNNSIFIKASDEYQRNTISIIKNYPADYLKSVGNEVYLFFNFGSGRLFDGFLVKWGQPRTSKWYYYLLDLADYYVVPLFFFVIFVAVMAFLFKSLIREWRVAQKNGWLNIELVAVYGFVLFNIIYVFFLSSVAELGESNLMRIPIDPYLIIGTILLIQAYFFKRFELKKESVA